MLDDVRHDKLIKDLSDYLTANPSIFGDKTLVTTSIQTKTRGTIDDMYQEKYLNILVNGPNFAELRAVIEREELKDIIKIGIPQSVQKLVFNELHLFDAKEASHDGARWSLGEEGEMELKDEVFQEDVRFFGEMLTTLINMRS